jgi:4-amino-4-deoxy-L-arabinose transferase-like glycosyltransferase
MPTSSSRTGRADAGAVAAIAAVFVVGAATVGPLRDVPVIDDWVYAWSVEQLVHAGRLQVLDLSSIYPIAHILWGALAARLFGFSFGVLRLATALLAAIGCSAFYVTLQEIHLPRGASLLAALALALNPVFFALSFSYMTDVPFVSLALVVLLCYVRGIERGREPFLWAGSAVAVAAFLIRPVGVLIPVTLAAAALGRPPRVRMRAWMMPLVVSLALMATAAVAMPRMFGPLEVASGRTAQLRWWGTIPASSYLAWNAGLWLQALMPFAPLLLVPILSRRGIVAVAAVAVVVWIVLHATIGTIPPPLPDWDTWSLQDVGARAMIGGDAPLSDLSARLAPLVTVVGLASASGFVIAAVRTVRRLTPAAAVIVSFGVLQWIAVNALWLFNDRYYLPFAPAVALVAAHAIETRVQRLAAAVLLAALAAVAVTGARDMLDANAAAAGAARDLECDGVPAWNIDAGYALNGWRLYAHPERLPVGADRRFAVPYVTSKQPVLYRVANTRLDGYDLVRVLPLDHAWWQTTDRLYLLRRRQPQPTARSGPTIH